MTLLHISMKKCLLFDAADVNWPQLTCWKQKV